MRRAHGELVAALLRFVFGELGSNFGDTLKSVALCALGGAVSAALHRLIAPPAPALALRRIS